MFSLQPLSLPSPSLENDLLLTWRGGGGQWLLTRSPRNTLEKHCSGGHERMQRFRTEALLDFPCLASLQSLYFTFIGGIIVAYF